MELPFTSGTELTPMAAACYPLARAAATGIEQDVLDLVSPKQKGLAQELAALLQRGAIFDKGVLAKLHDLVGCLMPRSSKEPMSKRITITARRTCPIRRIGERSG